MHASSPILAGLNPAQREAVIHYDRPSLIIAGAGSGKTRVLTSRIAYMIEQGVDPRSILALTFTNKAAEQMRERIGAMLPDGRSRWIRMGTFHSVFSRILRENAERIGYPASYTIYEPGDCRSLVKTIIKELSLPDERYRPNAILSRISFAKNCLVTPAAYAASSVYAAEDRQRQTPRFGEIYDLYCRRCKQNGAMDFDDLLLQTNYLLRDCPDVREHYQKLFQYILVDEYQDTNYAQYIIIRRLAQLHGRVCVVGDDAQSIYSFRGAKIENILSFRNDFPEAMTFKLEQNYRSTRTIVDAANSLIVHNNRRMDKECFSRGEEGEKITVLRAATDREEGEMIASALRDRRRDTDDPWSDMAILYRTNSQSQAIEEALRRKGIPYRIYKGSSFYDHKEVKDLLAYIRLVINPRDDEAFKRIINYPARGIGGTTVGRIEQIAGEQGIPMWEAVDRIVADPASVNDPVQRTIVRKVTGFVELIQSLSLRREELALYDMGLEIATRSGIIPAFRMDHSPEAEAALGNIEELLNTMQDFKEQRDAEIRGGERQADERATLEEWMQSVMLLTDMDNDDQEERDKVTLMTVHSSKGLEYKYVYIVGMEENLFPSARAMESADGLEEERRLFYVALTRAKCAATLSSAEMRFRWGNMEFSRPSRFLCEIDPEFLDIRTDEEHPGLRSTARPAGGGFAARAGVAGIGQGAHPSGHGQRTPDGKSAIDLLRERFDYRFQKRREAAQQTPQPNGPARPTPQGAPTPPAEHLRRVATRPAVTAAPADCPFREGDRVEHLKFGRGTVEQVIPLAEDCKLRIRFDSPAAGEKTLLAKFAKLNRI